jgi:hypothetical protein
MNPSKIKAEYEEKEPRNINGCPYGAKEFFNWIMKHIIIDFYYPFMILIYFLFVASVVTTSRGAVSWQWYLIFSILFLAFGIMFIYRMIQRIIHKIENIGELNEDGWREFEFEYSKIKSDDVKYKIGFVGDIMKMGDYDLKFEKRIKKFFNDTEVIVGNLEGIIATDTNNRKKGGIAAQSHNANILTQLKKIFNDSDGKETNQKWILSVANNHSADYGVDSYLASLRLINNDEGFIPIGDYNTPNYSWTNNNNKNVINIVAGTMWSNRKTKYMITQFKRCKPNTESPRIFNILYPHWHYENECYVRSKVQRKSINLQLLGTYMDRDWWIIAKIIEYFTPKVILRKIIPKIRIMHKIMKKIPKRTKSPELKEENQKWDLIFGHHPHVPQPITVYGKGILAYSGGNFTSSQKRKKHISGMIMKCEIGHTIENEHLSLRKIEWCYTINERIKKKTRYLDSDGKKHKRKLKEVNVIIDCRRTRKNYFANRKIKFSRNLVIFSVALGIWIGYFWIYFDISYVYWILYALLIIFEIVYFAIKNIKIVRR